MSEIACLVIVVQLKAEVELFLFLVAGLVGLSYSDWGGLMPLPLLLLLRLPCDSHTQGASGWERGVRGVNGIGLHLINCDLCAALRLICDIC